MKRERTISASPRPVFWGLPLGEFLIVALVALTIGIGIGTFALTSPANTSGAYSDESTSDRASSSSQVVENLKHESHHSSMRRK